MPKVVCCKRHSWYRTWCAPRFSATWAIDIPDDGLWSWAWPFGAEPRWSAHTCQRIYRLWHSEHWSVSARHHTAPLHRPSYRIYLSTISARKCWPCSTSPYQLVRVSGKSHIAIALKLCLSFQAKFKFHQSQWIANNVMCGENKCDKSTCRCCLFCIICIFILPMYFSQ